MSYIYKITNQLNNKIYVGATTRHPSVRFVEHCKDARRFPDRPLYIAINKYGKENFVFDILEECEENELEEKEKYWIEKLRSFKYGYNATFGGNGKRYIDYDVVVETYKQVGNIKDTALQLNISKDSVKQALNASCESVYSQKEVIVSKYGNVINMHSLNGEYIRTFASTYDAARYLISNNLTNCKLTTIKTHISEVCKGRRKTAAKFKWSYAN